MKILNKILLGALCLSVLAIVPTFANGQVVQTKVATNVSSNQAILNGIITNNYNISGPIYVWFQWGPTTAYGNETAHQVISYLGSFSQYIANLPQNTIYHYRAVVQLGNFPPIYGNDIGFVTGIVLVNPPINGQVLGASYVSTGITNDLVKDSFFLPLFLIILMAWLYFSGKIYNFSDWLKLKIQ